MERLDMRGQIFKVDAGAKECEGFLCWFVH